MRAYDSVNIYLLATNRTRFSLLVLVKPFTTMLTLLGYSQYFFATIGAFLFFFHLEIKATAPIGI